MGLHQQPSRPELRWDRARLEREVADQLAEGKAITKKLNRQLGYYKSHRFRLPPDSWHKRNLLVLRDAFTDSQVHDEYNAHIHQIYSADQVMANIRAQHTERVRRLRDVASRIDLFEEADPSSIAVDAEAGRGRATNRRDDHSLVRGLLLRLPLWRWPALSSGTVRAEDDAQQIFVVHGHDHATKNAVARVLHQLTGRDPVILHEQPDGGATIIEKYELHAGAAAAAVAILSPDDIGAMANDPSHHQHRARQNVVYELGWFHGRLGRGRVIALMVGDVEQPSDLGGVLYIPVDAAGSWRTTLGRELRHAGIDADLNQLT